MDPRHTWKQSLHTQIAKRATLELLSVLVTRAGLLPGDLFSHIGPPSTRPIVRCGSPRFCSRCVSDLDPQSSPADGRKQSGFVSRLGKRIDSRQQQSTRNVNKQPETTRNNKQQQTTTANDKWLQMGRGWFATPRPLRHKTSHSQGQTSDVWASSGNERMVATCYPSCHVVVWIFKDSGAHHIVTSLHLSTRNTSETEPCARTWMRREPTYCRESKKALGKVVANGAGLPAPLSRTPPRAKTGWTFAESVLEMLIVDCS